MIRIRRTFTVVGGSVTVGVLLALLVLQVAHGVHHDNKVTDQRDTLIATLQHELATVNQRLGQFDRELTVILTEKHAHPAQIRRLQHQIERLGRQTGPAPSPAPTVTVTSTTTPRPSPSRMRPETTPCALVPGIGKCLPTVAPSRGPAGSAALANAATA